MCSRGHDCVELNGEQTLASVLPTMPALQAAMQRQSSLQVICHAGCGATRGIVHLKCRGDDQDGRRCRGCSKDGDLSLLPQLIAAAPGQICDALLVEPEDGRLLRFDPCGHCLCIDAFITSVNVVVTGGEGRGKIARSPVTGQFAFSCPVGGPRCSQSFVHDIHHYKLCGLQQYELLKSWAFDRITDTLTGDVNAQEAQQPHQLSTALSARIQEALSEGAMERCPRCSRQGQKDGACTHMTCSGCAARFCYICKHSLPCSNGCQMYLTRIPGFSSTDPYLALQQYHVRKVKRLLHAIYMEEPQLFAAAVAADPSLLCGICGIDGIGANGRREHAAVPSVNLSIEDVAGFRPVR